MKSILFTSTLFLSGFLMAQEGQNLVPNGSFEEIGKAPRRLGSIESAQNWASPTGVRADLFTGDKVPDIAVPLNVRGKEDAKDGENYAGIVTYSYGQKVNRSYLMNKLNAPMKKDLKYCVEFYVSLSEASKYASNNIAIKFSNKAYSTDEKLPLYDEPSILEFDNEPITARYNWVKICGTYVAKGGEKFITIGNFSSDDKTEFARMKADKKSDIEVDEILAAYYYVDNVSVFLIDEEKDQKCNCQYGEEIVEYSNTIYSKTPELTDDMSVSEKIEAHQVYFAFGKAKLAPEGTSSLDFIAESMKANPDMRLQIFGHNNASEDEVALENELFVDMDMQRISTVMAYLMEKGISEGRLSFVTSGSDSPSEFIQDTDDEDLILAKSRRVTFKVK